jgi:hypothetical protein
MDIAAKFLFEKRLQPSDVKKRQGKLVIHRRNIDDRFLGSWTQVGDDEKILQDIPLRVYDRHEEKEITEEFVFKHQVSCDMFMFQKHWRKFVKRKELKADDTVFFWWNVFKK